MKAVHAMDCPFDVAERVRCKMPEQIIKFFPTIFDISLTNPTTPCIIIKTEATRRRLHRTMRFTETYDFQNGGAL